MAKKPSLVSQELLDAAKAPKARKGDRKPTDSVQHHIDATDVLGSLKLNKPKKASGGAVPIRIPVDKEDPEAYFRRLITWSFAVAPLFGRTGKAGGGKAVSEAIDLAKKFISKDDKNLSNIKSLSQSPISYDHKNVVRVPIEEVEHGESALPGGKLYMPGSRQLIEEYAARETPIPPIEAGAPSLDNPKWMVSDGSHRLEAAKMRGQTHIDVIPWWDKEDSYSNAVIDYLTKNKFAGGGSVEDIEAAIRAADEASKKQEASHEKGASGVVEFAPMSIEEPLTHTSIPLGSYPKETTEVIQPALQAASEIAPYFTPAAPIAAARDVAVGLREGDPTNVALSALGLPGKAAKAAAIGASAFMPEEAEAGTLSKIAKFAKAGAKLPPVPLEHAMERVVSPFSQDPDKVRQALELARDLRIQQEVSGPKSDYYLVGQSRAPKDVTTKIEPIPNLPLKETNPMSWEDFYNTAKGATFINLGGDRSNFGRLTHINDQELSWPIDLHAGAKYMLEPSPGAVWANAPGPATGFKKAVSQAAREGDVYGVFSPMGPTAVDSSHNMFDALMAQIPNQKISKKAAKEFDQAIMSGSHWGSPEEKKKAAELLENWPGISNPKEASEFARQLPGGHRRAIVQYMDTKGWRDKGFPMVGETRVAITDPELRGAPKSMMGHRVVKFNPENITPETSFEHSTYPVATGGEYVGDVPLSLRHYVMPEALERIVTQPAKDKSIIHPFSVDPRGRSSARKFFEEQKLQQQINQRFLDSVMQEQERRQKYGLKKGGSVISDALDVVSNLPK